MKEKEDREKSWNVFLAVTSFALCLSVFGESSPPRFTVAHACMMIPTGFLGQLVRCKHKDIP